MQIQYPNGAAGINAPDAARGYMKIYDNIFSWQSSNQSMIEMTKNIDVTNPTPLSLEIYNNTFYSKRSAAIELASGLDSLRFKNNIMYHTGKIYLQWIVLCIIMFGLIWTITNIIPIQLNVFGI